MRLSAIARKEFLHVLRDKRSLAMAVAMPLLLLSLFGFALTLDLDRVPLVVWDASGTAASRELISKFTGSRYFKLIGAARNYRETEELIDRGTALLALVVPPQYAERLKGGGSSAVQLILDGSDANTATVALGYAEAIIEGHAQNILSEDYARQTGVTLRYPVEFRARAWFNPDMRSQSYIVPALIAVILMILSALLTSLTFARERERGTMEQLISTPVQASELVFGKLIPYFVIGMFDVLLAVLMGKYLFLVPLRGSILLLFIMSAVFLVSALSMGMLISIVARNQLEANQLAMLTTFIPAFLLSGLIFPIYNMPGPVEAITYLVPARYFVTLLRGLYLKGTGPSVLWPEVATLVVFGLVTLILADKRLKKRVR